MKRSLLGIIFLFVLLISGCSEENNDYSGIEKNDIAEISNSKFMEFVYQYKGSTDNWAANYIVYKMKNTDNHTSRLLLKYIGPESERPTGEFKYKYQTESGGSGSGTLSNAEIIKGDIFSQGISGGNGALAAQDSLVKVEVYWNGNTENFELKPELSK
jgi:hypothetical protein